MSLLRCGELTLGPAQTMSIKVGRKTHDMRIVCRIARVRSTQQSVGIIK